MYPMGRERWKPMRWGLDGCFSGMRKTREGMSSMRTHRRMYTSARYTLLR